MALRAMDVATNGVALGVPAQPEAFRFHDESTVDPVELINSGLPRLVMHMTVTAYNIDQIEPNYAKVAALQDHATAVGSPTEVLFAFRPQPLESDMDSVPGASDLALTKEHMPAVNRAIGAILADTYDRLASGNQRVLANSSGFAWLYADPAFREEALQQDVGHPGNQLVPAGTSFEDLDVAPDPINNRFSDFQHGNYPYLPSLSTLPRSAEAAQPTRMMDRRLARMIVLREGLQFFSTEENLRNKSDSPHILGNPRRLGSDPYEGRYLAERLLHIAQTECEGNLLMGLASYGLGLAATASALSTFTDRPLRFNYVKLVAEEWKGKEKVEGDLHLDDQAILVDDLIFHGSTTRGAVEIVKGYGFIHPIRDLIYIVNRQLQHRGKFEGRSLEEDGYRVHNAITMDQIIRYMLERNAITPGQLADAVEDYRMHDRCDMPDFARPEAN